MSRKSILTTILAAVLALAAWGGKTLVSHGERLSKTETQVELMDKWLERVEEKLDRVLGR